MNWGSSWDDKKPLSGKAIAKRQAEAGAINWPNLREIGKQAEELLKRDTGIFDAMLGVPLAAGVLTGWDLGSGDKTVTALIEDGKVIKVYANKTPTHDPYTNPNAHIYYSCKCGQILDPGTKSFSQLNNAASEAGWKIRFGDQHYEAHCVECGKEVE